MGEEAVEHLFLVFTEMVEAQTAGDAELVGDRQRAFAEECELIELVAKIGEEERVLGCAKAARRDPCQILETNDGKGLAVVPVRTAEEAAGHEGQAPRAAGKP